MHTEVVRRVFSYSVIPVDADINTGVENFTVVTGKGRSTERKQRSNHSIIRHAVIVIYVNVQAVVESDEVDAGIPLFNDFPFQSTEIGVVLITGDCGIAKYPGCAVTGSNRS